MFFRETLPQNDAEVQNFSSKRINRIAVNRILQRAIELSFPEGKPTTDRAPLLIVFFDKLNNRIPKNIRQVLAIREKGYWGITIPFGVNNTVHAVLVGVDVSSQEPTETFAHEAAHAAHDIFNILDDDIREEEARADRIMNQIMREMPKISILA